MGSTGAKAMRFTPFILFTIMVAPTANAPLFPALAKASPPPSQRARSPTAMELPDLALSTLSGSSSIVSTSVQCRTSILLKLPSSPSSLALLRSLSLSPATLMSMPSSSMARAQPKSISPGALSPPKPSTIMRMISPFRGQEGPVLRAPRTSPACPGYVWEGAAVCRSWRP